MKKKIHVLILSLFIGINLYAQTPSTIVGQLPSITPPSPTVAGLMKFEEVAVDNYTGIPNISIPLYSVETLSKDINMNIALKYHPSSIAIDETASYTGLGWSLFAGGSISRTVKGSPDEQAEFFGGVPRIGILQDNINDTAGNDFINRYEQVLSLLGSTTLTNEQIKLIGNYGWGVAQKGVFDTQRDLFQYNFMGHTGRFIIKRDATTGALVPLKLDNDNAITIKLNYSESYSYTEHRYTITLNGFELNDDKGYKYIFGTKGQGGPNEEKVATEITEEYNNLRSTGFKVGSSSVNPNLSPSVLKYPSAYHLTEIYDNNDKLLVKITYKKTQENTSKRVETHNYITAPKNFINTIKYAVGGVFGLLPESSISVKGLDVASQKLDVIEITNKARIYFDTATGRYDSNINEGAPFLNSLTVKNWYGELIKKYEFSYDYATITSSALNANNLSRLILTGVHEKNTLNATESLNHELSYKEPSIYVTTRVLKDYWGYFSRRANNNKEPDPYWCSAQVLEKITLPTGGSINFDFGSNTYSSIGSEPVTDFSIDNDYYDPITIQVPEDGEIGIYPGVTVPTDSFHSTDSPMIGGKISIQIEGDPVIEPIDALGDNGLNDGTGIGQIITLEPGRKYLYSYKTPAGVPKTGKAATVKLYKTDRYGKFTKTKAFDDKWLLGGGVRINKISYFTNDVSSSEPVKVKRYNYQFLNDATRSSGSLAFAKPLYKFWQGSYVFYPVLPGGTTNPDPLFEVAYSSTTTHNSLSYIRTKGSDVGYKNVTVWETGNGKSEYVYTSPIDYSGNYDVNPPFRPTEHVDYKRGILKSEKHYNEFINSTDTIYRPISEKIYDYNMDTYDENRSIGHIMDIHKSAKVAEHQNYGSYRSCVTTSCGWGWSTMNDYYFYHNLGGEIRELFGWPTLSQKTSKEYSYEGNGTTAKTITTTETYEYNFLNKQLNKTTLTNSLGEILTNNYYYDTNGSNRNRIGVIKKIESKRGSAIIETKDITYASNIGSSGNVAWLPQTISVSKGTNTLEPRVQFIKYDQYSNPLEAKQENGMSVCYIWGYNSSQPIAVIENIAYSAINAQKIAEAQAASNVLTATETQFIAKNTQLLTKLEALRTSLPATAMMSAYIYRPLVGVVTTIDPRGFKTTYSYDGYGRLKEVRDNDGYLLSENDYKYRN